MNINNYKVSFYTKHNPDLQSGTIHANSEDHARRMFEVTGCQVESVEQVPAKRCVCFELAGDNPDCPIHGHGDDSTAWDKERDELRTMGQGG